jgi:hypothetical protein
LGLVPKESPYIFLREIYRIRRLEEDLLRMVV